MHKVASSSEPTLPIFFLIGELAEQTGLNATAIRFYEHMGLITPQRHGRFRIYSSSDAERLAVIIALRDMGLPVKTIGQLIRELPDPGKWRESAAIKAALDDHKRDLVRQQDEVNRQIERLEGLLLQKPAIAA